MALEVSSDLIIALEAEAQAAYPHECCGILVGVLGRIEAILPTANVHPAPETHFEIDPQALVDAHRTARSGGPQVAGYYHSHPSGPASPSATDSAMAARDGTIWAIIGAGEVAFWHDGEDGFEALPYRIVDR